MITYTLFSYFETLETIVGEMQGLLSKMGHLDFKAGVKDEIQHWQRFAGHDFLSSLYIPNP